ncbi:MAG: hypothetical protein ACI8UG_002520 [Gammaproteobacteria bacterium]
MHIQNLHLETAKVDEFIEILKPTLNAFVQFYKGEVIEVHKLSGVINQSNKIQADVKQRLQVL